MGINGRSPAPFSIAWISNSFTSLKAPVTGRKNQSVQILHQSPNTHQSFHKLVRTRKNTPASAHHHTLSHKHATESFRWSWVRLQPEQTDVSRQNINTELNWQSNGSPSPQETNRCNMKKAANHLALGLRITRNCFSLPDNCAITQLIVLLRSSEQGTRLLGKLQSMNGRLFPAVRVNVGLATVVRHRGRMEPNSCSEQPLSQAATARRRVRKDPTMETAVWLLRRRQTHQAFSFVSPFSITHFTAFKCAHNSRRERARSRAVARLVF